MYTYTNYNHIPAKKTKQNKTKQKQKTKTKQKKKNFKSLYGFKMAAKTRIFATRKKVTWPKNWKTAFPKEFGSTKFGSKLHNMITFTFLK